MKINSFPARGSFWKKGEVSKRLTVLTVLSCNKLILQFRKAVLPSCMVTLINEPTAASSKCVPRLNYKWVYKLNLIDCSPRFTSTLDVIIHQHVHYKTKERCLPKIWMTMLDVGVVNKIQHWCVSFLRD